MSVAQTSCVYSYALHSDLTVAILLSPSLYSRMLNLSITRRKCRSSPPLSLSLPVTTDLMVTYHSYCGRAATITTRCQYLGKRKTDYNVADRKQNLDLPSKDVEA